MAYADAAKHLQYITAVFENQGNLFKFKFTLTLNSLHRQHSGNFRKALYKIRNLCYNYIKIKKLEVLMARKHFSGGALTAPVPPILVTVGDMESSNIITIGWTGILATHPPRTYISVRPERFSYGILKEKGEFVINLAPASLVREVDFCGIYTGAKLDKFKKCGFSKTASREVVAPTIAECPIALECRVCEILPMGTHDVFVADIVSASCDESVLDSSGKIRFDKANLLAYAHGEYFRLGEVLGKFGFSTEKKKNPPKTPSLPEKSKQKDAKSTDKTTVAKAEKRPFYLSAPRGNNKRKKGAKPAPVSKNRSKGAKKN